MARANVLVNNFNGGEFSRLIESRSDLSKYASGCRRLENAIPLVEGGAKKMPGTIFAGIAGNGGPLGTATTGKSRLVPFQFSTLQTAIIEFCAGFIRIWMDGGLIESGNPLTPIVVATPYAEADLFDLDVSTQSADVLYIFHSSYPPASLNRISNTNWTYTLLSLYGTEDVVKTGYSALGQCITSITQANPAVVTVVGTGSNAPFANGDRIYINLCAGMMEFNQGQFIVSNMSATAPWTFNLLPLNSSGGGSVAALTPGFLDGPFSSNPAGIYNTTGGTGTGLTVGVGVQHRPDGTWVITSVFPINGGTGYYVGDIIHFVVLSETLSATVNAVIGSSAIDSTHFLTYEGGGFAVKVPALFNSAGNYPACATFHQERFCIAGSTNNPTQMNGSTQDDFPDFIADPNEDDYAIQFTLVSQQIDQIRWMIGTPNALLLGTASGVWAMFSPSGTSLSQTNVMAAKQTSMGVGAIAPQLVNDAIIWVTRSTYIVRLLIYNWITNQWEGPDLTRLNREITVGPSEPQSGIVQTAFQRDPYFIFWAVRADGQLIGLTYEREDQVFAWFRIVTDGIIESVACISQDGAEDQVWISVQRTVNGVAQRYIEYFTPQGLFNELSNGFFVHCGLQWQGVGPFTITGISQANPCVVTAPGHTLQNGQSVRITGVQGMTQANNDPASAWIVAGVSGNTFQLQNVDSTGWNAYTSGGSASQVTNTVTGLQYIQGQSAVAVGDGAKIWQGTVPSNGQVTFAYYANLVSIGLTFQTIIEPMNPTLGNPQQTSKGKKQKISRVTFSLCDSIGGQYGNDQQHLHLMAYGPGAKGLPPALFTGNITRDLDGDWQDEATISIVHGEPFPFTLRSVIPRVDVAEMG
jgi:hypothetical protein